MDLNDL